MNHVDMCEWRENCLRQKGPYNSLKQKCPTQGIRNQVEMDVQIAYRLQIGEQAKGQQQGIQLNNREEIA